MSRGGLGHPSVADASRSSTAARSITCRSQVARVIGPLGPTRTRCPSSLQFSLRYGSAAMVAPVESSLCLMSPSFYRVHMPLFRVTFGDPHDGMLRSINGQSHPFPPSGCNTSPSPTLKS